MNILLIVVLRHCMATWICVNIGSCYGLFPEGIKLLPQPISTCNHSGGTQLIFSRQIYGVFHFFTAQIGQFHDLVQCIPGRGRKNEITENKVSTSRFKIAFFTNSRAEKETFTITTDIANRELTSIFGRFYVFTHEKNLYFTYHETPRSLRSHSPTLAPEQSHKRYNQPLWLHQILITEISLMVIYLKCPSNLPMASELNLHLFHSSAWRLTCRILCWRRIWPWWRCVCCSLGYWSSSPTSVLDSRSTSKSASSSW